MLIKRVVGGLAAALMGLALAACTEVGEGVSSLDAPNQNSSPTLAAADSSKPETDNPQFRDVPFSELEAKARAILSSLQSQSFSQNREYCGFIGVDKSGRLKAAYGSKGSATRCGAKGPRSWRIIASYHTHGAYDGVSASEWPSLQDVRGDMRRGIDGFISTPGGRFWHINPKNGFSRQICGKKCLGQDPDFQDDRIIPRDSYSVRQLARFYAGVARVELPHAGHDH